ncbi:MAG: DOMON-like domain-containing protein [Hyphomonadaceae bacterium]
MLHELICHPDTPSAAVDRIDVAIARPEPGLLALRYTVSGRIASISLAPPSEPLRTDDLWRTTCFEAFVESTPGAGYYEFNLSPSSKWAAYHFTDYREGMALAELSPPAIITGANATHIDVDALIYLPASQEPWQLALTAVIEETNGVHSYWALRHPPGKPDFHHADGFVLELPT